MSWTAIFLLAGGAYVFKALGLLVVGPAMLRQANGDKPADPGMGDVAERNDLAADPDGVLMQLGKLLPPALLASLVVSQTVVTGTSLVVDARLAGVAAGALAVWRGAPFWLVLLIAAAVTATLRLVAG